MKLGTHAGSLQRFYSPSPKTDNNKELCFYWGPSMKYVRSEGKQGVKKKAYIYCFYDVILLFKKVYEEEGVFQNPKI